MNVNKARAVLFAAVFVAGGAFAMDDMHMDPKMMDTNGDGMISKAEFMKFHEGMWAKMKKTKSGMVDIKDMEKMMSGGMMKHGSMMKDGSMMKEKTAK
jgi:hypothetical protein